jgi:hypothetical protein
MCHHTGSTFHQVTESACTSEPCCRAVQGLPRQVVSCGLSITSTLGDPIPAYGEAKVQRLAHDVATVAFTLEENHSPGNCLHRSHRNL